ncbi:MAG: Ig-like domain-containing protein [Candidatus Gracilibacteria bacterium]
MLRQLFIEKVHTGLQNSKKHIHRAGDHFHIHRKKYLASHIAIAILFVVVSLFGGSRPGKVLATTTPVVTIQLPGISAADVAITDTIYVGFSEEMQSGDFTTSTFKVLNSNTLEEVPGTVTYVGFNPNAGPDGAYVASFDPTSSLANFTPYRVVVKASTGGVRSADPALVDLDAGGQAWPWNDGTYYSYVFTTIAAPPTPTVTSTTPYSSSGLNGSIPAVTQIDPTGNVIVYFSAAMSSISITAEGQFTVVEGAGQTPVAGSVTYNDSGDSHYATFDPTSSLSAGTNFTVKLVTNADTGVESALGGALVSNIMPGNAYYTFSFATRAAAGPYISSTSPSRDATNQSVASTITVNFSEAIDSTSIDGTPQAMSDTFKVYASDYPLPAENQENYRVSGTIVTAENGLSATFTPASNLSPMEIYTVFLVGGVTGIKAQDGITPMTGDVVWSFQTGVISDSTSPTIQSRSPLPNATGVGINDSIVVTFDEALSPNTVSLMTFTVAPTLGGSAVVSSVALSNSNQTATFLAPAMTGYAYSTQYTVTLNSGITDVASNPFVGTVWTFTTAAQQQQGDVTAPTVSSVVPTVNATDVSTNSTVIVFMGEAMDPNFISNASMHLENAQGAVGGTVSYNSDIHSITLTPSSALTAGSLYTATIWGANADYPVKDVAGNSLAASYSWSFTTAMAQNNNNNNNDNSGPAVTFSRTAVTGVDAANGPVYFVVNAEDGTTYMGGAFSQVGGLARNGLAAIDSNGDVTSWNPGLNAGAVVYTWIGADQGIYIGGDFTYGNPVTHTNVMKVHVADNDVDAWDPGIPNDVVRTMVATTSTVWIGGDFTAIGNTSCTRLAALAKSDATVNCAESFSADGSVKAMTLGTSDSTLFIGGAFSTVGVASREKIAVFDITGSPTLEGWNLTMNGTVNTVYFDKPTEWLYAGGAFTSVDQATRNHIAAFNFSGNNGGALDANWNPNIDGTVERVYAANAEVYVGGSFATVNGDKSRTNAASFEKADGTATGTAEPWNPTLSNTVYDVYVGATQIDLGGAFITQGYLARYVVATAGVTLSSATLSLTEGSIVDQYSVMLNSVPTGDVAIAITPDSNSTVDSSTITFTSSNWYTPQTIIVTPVNNLLVDGTHSTTIAHVATSADGGYNGITISDVTGTIYDNDVAVVETPEVPQGASGSVIMMGSMGANGVSGGPAAGQFGGRVGSQTSLSASGNSKTKMTLIKSTTLWTNKDGVAGESYEGDILAPRNVDQRVVDRSSSPTNIDKILSAVELPSADQVTLTRLAKLEMALPEGSIRRGKVQLYYVDKNTGKWEEVPLGRIDRENNTFRANVRKIGGTYILVQQK